MLTHRIAHALRRQDWTLIVIDLVVVVLGILIAIGFNNWNQARQDAVQAIEWRAAVVDDLAGTRDELDYRRVYYGQALDFAKTALAGLEKHEDVSAEQAWQIVLGAFQAGQIWPLEITGPVYRQVQSAGKLHLLGDQQVLAMLSRFYDISANDFKVIAGDSPPYRALVRERMPWAIQEYIWEGQCQAQVTDERSGGFVFTLVACDKPEMDALLQQTVAQLRADRHLQSKLRGRMSQLKIVVATLGRQHEHIGQVMDAMR